MYIVICCRLSYAVYLIEELVKQHDKADIYVMYDIACTLHRHLKVHNYCHNCRVAFSPFSLTYSFLDGLTYWRGSLFVFQVFILLVTRHHAKYALVFTPYVGDYVSVCMRRDICSRFCMAL